MSGELRLAGVSPVRPDAQGSPALPDERLDDLERVFVGRYLRRAPIAVAAYGFDVDPFDPARPEVVPLHLHTDGFWVWSESLAYFATRHGIAPEPEFLAHLKRYQYQPPGVAPDVLRRAAQLAMG
ncbi:hypothetical protein GCM10023322_57980 [Rugosimonospora acidiphila]|uniref:Uncharacterized protein n=1 Tax=Rugosimonospora acidiphila TaxID=556531 RepID=A0ABP9SCH8_9ACTN